MKIKNAIATVSVSDSASSFKWYEALFDRPPDSEPMPQLAEWKFSGGGWLQVAEDKDRAGGSSVTLSVASIEKTLSHLENLGVGVDQSPSSEIVEIAICVDPDGNRLVFAEPKSTEIAQ